MLESVHVLMHYSGRRVHNTILDSDEEIRSESKQPQPRRSGKGSKAKPQISGSPVDEIDAAFADDDEAHVSDAGMDGGDEGDDGEQEGDADEDLQDLRPEELEQRLADEVRVPSFVSRVLPNLLADTALDQGRR